MTSVLSFSLSVYFTEPLPSCAVTVNITVYSRLLQVTPVYVQVSVFQKKKSFGKSYGGQLYNKLGAKMTATTQYHYMYIMLYFRVIIDRMPQKHISFEDSQMNKILYMRLQLASSLKQNYYFI